jgi:hypothetical protein
VTVAVSGSAYDQRRQQHHGGAQVVLDRVREEDGAEEQTSEREPVRDPVRAAANLRLRNQLDEAAHDGDDGDRPHDKSGDEDGVEKDAPRELATVSPRPAL